MFLCVAEISFYKALKAFSSWSLPLFSIKEMKNACWKAAEMSAGDESQKDLSEMLQTSH